MKYVLILGDGMADEPLEELGEKHRWLMQIRLPWMHLPENHRLVW